MSLITLYARKEPTTDALSVSHGLRDRKDTVIYKDKECTNLVARWPWYQSSCPRRNQKRITLNCWPWNLSWV